jgi:CDP-diacylglycerol--glycerol-3-phosphate 3-phosphatidyltransferase
MFSPPLNVAGLGRVGRRTHRSPDASKEASWSAANNVTALRCLLGAGLLAVAALQASWPLLVVALALCWLGDVADGLVARGLRCESVLGAQFDSYADRLVVASALVASIAVYHGATALCVGATATWLQFGCVDQFMSSQFLRFDLWTSDELHLVNAALWRLNFAPIAKIVSNVPTALVMVGGAAAWVAAALALTLVAVRISSFALSTAGATRSSTYATRSVASEGPRGR